MVETRYSSAALFANIDHLTAQLKPKTVQAFRVTDDLLPKIATHFGGAILFTGTGVSFTWFPGSKRQRIYVGDWIIYHDGVLTRLSNFAFVQTYNILKGKQ